MGDGVVAIGDSITSSCGFPTGNLPLASWAQWVARSLSEPITIYARSGASTAEIRRNLLPEPGQRYRLALVYAGTNDLLRGRSTHAFRDDFDAVMHRAAEVAEAVLTLTPPLWLGRVPTIAPYGRRLPRVYAYAEAIRTVAATVGALAVQGPELSGPRYVAADRIHPTAAGQLAFADAAAWALRDAGWTLDLPSSLVDAPAPVTARERRVWVAATAKAAVTAPARTLARALRS